MDPNDPSTYSDDDLRTTFVEAKRDLEQAARDEPESEWHQGCFAAVILLSREMAARRLKLGTTH